MWPVHAMKCSAINRNGGLTATTTWVNFQNTVLSETCPTRKATHCTSPLTRNGQIREAYYGDGKWAVAA